MLNSKLIAKWEAKLAREGMPPEPVVPRRNRGVVMEDSVQEGDSLAHGDRLEYWTDMTHAVNALPINYPKRDRRFLLAYVETGYLTLTCRGMGIGRRVGRTILKRFVAYQANQPCQEMKEYNDAE